jgi:hypothetical protein
LCSITGHTGCALDHDIHGHCRRHFGHFGTYVVGESCKGLYSPGDSYRGIPGPTPSGPESLWRIPDGARVTFHA